MALEKEMYIYLYIYFFIYPSIHPAPPSFDVAVLPLPLAAPHSTKMLSFFFFSSGLILQREPGVRAIYSEVKTQVGRARAAGSAFAHGTNARTGITRWSQTDLTEGLVCCYF